MTKVTIKNFYLQPDALDLNPDTDLCLRHFLHAVEEHYIGGVEVLVSLITVSKDVVLGAISRVHPIVDGEYCIVFVVGFGELVNIDEGFELDSPSQVPFTTIENAAVVVADHLGVHLR